MAALFVALAIEWIAVELLQRVDSTAAPSFAAGLLRRLPRFTGTALALILVSGIAMAVRFGVHRSGWVVVAFAAMVLMGGLGGAALRPLLRSASSGGSANGTWQRQASNPFLRVSLRARVGVALGIVYLMVAKPALLESAAIVIFALAAGVAAGVVGVRSAASAAPDAGSASQLRMR
jgi:hypothetical protein